VGTQKKNAPAMDMMNTEWFVTVKQKNAMNTQSSGLPDRTELFQTKFMF
jgi:hypothetical protein